VELGGDAELKWISHLLGLQADWLKQALTSKVTVSAGKRLFLPFQNFNEKRM
jgi:myosin-15